MLWLGGRASRTVERRYHNPYRHWFSGLATEIAVFAGVLAVLVVIALAAARLAE